jgi:flagellar motor switch protein FliM
VPTNLSPEELGALLPAAAATAPAQVEPRDFRRPRRLSTERVSALAERAAEALPELQELLAARLRRACTVAVAGCGEIDAAEAWSAAHEHAPVLRAELGGEPAWLLWESPAALAAAEIALGGEPAQEPAPRALSSVERTLIDELLGKVAALLARALGADAKSWRGSTVALEREALADAGGARDPARVWLHVSVDAGSSASTLRLYLPGLASGGDAPKAPPAPRALPAHLEEIEVDLVAALGAVDIPLSELLALEVGDVIPLALEADTTLDVSVEDVPWASASWGRHEERLALRLKAREPRPESN